MQETAPLSPEEKKRLGEEYTVLSMLIRWGNKTDNFCDSAKEIAEQFVPLTDDERAAKLEELKEFAPRTPTRRQVEDRFYQMFPKLKQWSGWDP